MFTHSAGFFQATSREVDNWGISGYEPAEVHLLNSACVSPLATSASRQSFQLAPSASQAAVGTSYFLVNGRVTIGEASLQVHGLVERHGPTTHLVWLREV